MFQYHTGMAMAHRWNADFVERHPQVANE
jgi:hypothetical protein